MIPIIKVAVSASILLSVAIALLNLSVDFFKEGLITEATACGAIGVALVIGTFLLVREGIITTVKEMRL